MFRRAVLLAGAVLVAAPAFSQVELVHLGNEGFLIADGETKILVDALYGDGLPGYNVVPAKIRRELEAASGPFAGVDLVLATHHHGDHFDPRAVGRHLAANPGARFVSTKQAQDQLRKRFDGYGEVGRRVSGLWPDEGRTVEVEHAGVRVTILNLHHGRARRPAVQNLGFLIEIGGVRLLHVGDTEVSVGDVRPYELGERGIDVALLPTWIVSQKALVDEIGARRLVAMHLSAKTAPAGWFGPAKTYEGQIERLRSAAPGMWVPEEAMASRRFSGLE